jgi:dihydrofolate reductase
MELDKVPKSFEGQFILGQHNNFSLWDMSYLRKKLVKPRMTRINSIFIATSIDGYIADSNGNIDWLHSIPNPTHDDMGYDSFIKTVDAIIMGRTTFETVCSFDIAWPYSIPVFVLSNSLTEIPKAYKGKAYLAQGPLNEILAEIHGQGFHKLYIDGGKTIQSFLQEDLIDEMTITTIPILLGSGFSLFGELSKPLRFECKEIKHLLDSISQSRYVRTTKDN